MAYTPEQRQAAIDKVLAELCKGTPLTVICASEGMPNDDTIRLWADTDEVLSRAIARAREVGFDTLAIEALKIADDGSLDTIDTKFGPKPDKEWIDRSKLRVDTRLKLLAKWDPKRYGEKLQHTGDGGGDIKIAITSEDAGL